jgi:succinate dehydrogenase/fumarate reductase cytochrome b subunit
MSIPEDLEFALFMLASVGVLVYLIAYGVRGVINQHIYIKSILKTGKAAQIWGAVIATFGVMLLTWMILGLLGV